MGVDRLTRGGNYYEIGLWTTRHPKPPCEVANDREPNDADATAHDVALGERVDGILCPSKDRDEYRFHATSRMRLQIRIDRDTGSKPSSWGNPLVEVWSDRTDIHGKWNWQNGSVLEFWVPETGDYYASVATTGGVNIKYSLTVLAAGSVPNGPGEPVATRVGNLGYPLAFAVAQNGDFYVSDEDKRIWKVSATGEKSLFVGAVPSYPNSLAFEASGNLLVATFSIVCRASPAGQITPLFTSGACPWCGDIAALTVATDGTIWITTLFRQIKHFDRDGHLMDSTSVVNANPTNPSGLGQLAFAPDRTLYFVSGNGIYRLVSGRPELFVRDTAEVDAQPLSTPIGGLAFDVEGNLYVTHPMSGGISLYDRNGAEIWNPYAWVPGAPRAIAFGRNADGSINGRLFVLSNTNLGRQPPPQNGTIYELHSSESPPPPPPAVTVEQAVAELLHPGRLSTEQLATLDQRGNSNGRYDIGDLRAFLIANGMLAAAGALRQ